MDLITQMDCSFQTPIRTSTCQLTNVSTACYGAGQSGTAQCQLRGTLQDNFVVTQAEDYMYRPIEFKSFSLYELVCMTYRREISRKTEEPSSSESSNSDHSTSDSSDSGSDEKKQRRGRQTTFLFHFQSPHPLKETHALALLQRFSVAQIIRKVPAAPGSRPDSLTDRHELAFLHSSPWWFSNHGKASMVCQTLPHRYPFAIGRLRCDIEDDH